MVKLVHRHKAYFAFLGHRVSGLLLALFLPVHFYVLGLALDDVSGLDRFLAFSQLPGVKFAEWGLVILLSMHLFFGLRLLIIEFVSWPTPQSLRLNLVGWGVALSVVIGLFFLLGVFGQ